MYASPTHEFKEDVLVVYAFQKTEKKKFYYFFENFVLSIGIKKIEEIFSNRINVDFKRIGTGSN